MDWFTGINIVAIAAGVTISLVVLVAVGSIRRSLNEAAARQSQQIRKLTETVATLSAQHQAAQTRIQQLTDANRKMSDELTALGERLSDADTVQHRRNLWASPMHDHGAQPGTAEHDDVLGKGALQPFVSHGIAAVLHHHRGAAEWLEPRGHLEGR